MHQTISQEHREIIEDICYLEHLLESESKEIKQKIITRVATAQSMEHKVEVLSDEVAKAIATISTRVQIIEKALQLQEDSVASIQKNAPELKIDTHVNNTALCDSLKIAILDIAKRNNLHGMKRDDNQVPYFDIFGNQEINFVLPINRTVKQCLAIDTKSTAPNVLDKVEIAVDGHHLKHRIKTVSGTVRLICYLPKSSTGNTTYISLTMPKEGRDVSLGLSDVHCVPKKSVKNMLSEWLG
ncbi:hypothetical protein [Vibrio rotiferianus]|uniref:hypothetical protein n=1 Tax=Vibrio rotiferianus TaxID=190895 RepID=UPI0028946D4E|nr:hypothetical protein THOE12_130063 [Vibrio rotiferianus]